MFTKPQTDFLNKQNIQRWLQNKAQQNKGNRWCKNHPASYWGRDKTGSYYSRCAEGFRRKEKCEVGE